MKIFLTGAGGSLGGEILNDLTKKFKVYVFSNNKKTKFKYLDYSKKKSIQKIIDTYGCPDVFIHVAWGDVLNPNSNNHLKKNFSNTKNLIDVFIKNKLKKFIFLGSIDEYGDHNGFINERHKPKGKLRKYEKGKLKVLKYCFQKKEIINNNTVYLHLRLTNIFVPKPKKFSLIAELNQRIKLSKSIELPNFEYYRDLLHVRDLTKILTKLIVNKRIKSLVINIGSKKLIKYKKFIEKYWKILGGKKIKWYQIKSSSDPRRIRLLLDNTRLDKIIGSVRRTNILNEIQKKKNL